MLRNTARSLKASIRRNDRIIRYGSRQFLIVFNTMKKESFHHRVEEMTRALPRQGISTVTDKAADPSPLFTIRTVFTQNHEAGDQRTTDELVQQMERADHPVCFAE